MAQNSCFNCLFNNNKHCVINDWDIGTRKLGTPCCNHYKDKTYIRCINCKRASQTNGLLYCNKYKLKMVLEYATKECDSYETWGDNMEELINGK